MQSKTKTEKRVCCYLRFIFILLSFMCTIYTIYTLIHTYNMHIFSTFFAVEPLNLLCLPWLLLPHSSLLLLLLLLFELLLQLIGMVVTRRVRSRLKLPTLSSRCSFLFFFRFKCCFVFFFFVLLKCVPSFNAFSCCCHQPRNSVVCASRLCFCPCIV